MRPRRHRTAETAVPASIIGDSYQLSVGAIGEKLVSVPDFLISCITNARAGEGVWRGLVIRDSYQLSVGAIGEKLVNVPDL